MTNYQPKKRSLTLSGHKTSVSIEDPFWDYFHKIAKKENQSINKLATNIDFNRPPNVGLATSIRIFCFLEATKLNL